MKIPTSITTMLAGIVLTLVSFWYGQNHGLLPVVASKEAFLIDGLFNTMMTISTGLYLLVIGVIVIAIIRFRRRPGDTTDGPPVHGNIPLEILWTSIPAVIVLGLGIYSFEVYNSIGGLNPMDHSMAHGHSTQQMAKMPGAAIAATINDAPSATTLASTAATPEPSSSPSSMVIKVTALQYAWLFTYPDTGVVSSELHVPVGQEVLLDMTANDVIHAFWVPEYRLKQDVIPGRQSELRFTPTLVGEYPVVCAELCGPYHGVMRTKVIAESVNDFNTWMQEQQVANANGLDQAIAVNPTDQDPHEFLAPYVSPLGVDAKILDQLHAATNHSLHHSQT